MKKIMWIVVLLVVLWWVAFKMNFFENFVESENVWIANPASVFCEQHGGVLETLEWTWGQYSLCHLPSGEICEERAYFRWECWTEGNPCDDDAPVCALVHVQCVTTPCDPVEQTFPNMCQMKENPLAVFLHDGACVTK